MRPLAIWLNTLFGLLLSCDGVCSGQASDFLRRSDDPGIGSPHADAQRLFDESDYELALVECDRTLDEEFPARIYNRIQATAVRCCLLLDRPEDALERIETIYERDPASPYLSLIPLVWDHRLPAGERFMAQAQDLHSDSAVRRLAAASSLLQQSQHTKNCTEILTKVRAARRLPLSILAETQLWRVQLPMTDSVGLLTVRRWQKRAADLPESLRAGPQFVVGRGFQLRHKPDPASLEFLWLPLMPTDDPYLAASALAESILCLEVTGRVDSALRLRHELRDRFRHTSAARRIISSDPSLPIRIRSTN